MEKDEEGFLYPVIDVNTCIRCMACVKVCAFHNKEYNEKIPGDQEVFALKHPDRDVRERSSSGGAFTLISDYVLAQGGSIYGAVFNESFEVIHSKACNRKQRDKMRGSKYVQSNLGSIFKEVKSELETGKPVLFTGTPCQTGGLKSYLGREYTGLILCDIVCHGGPSPKVWEDYRTYLEGKYRDKIRDINFRNKDSGWRNSFLKVEFNRSVYKKSMQEDPYYILFFSHLIIRPSCHQCVYTSYHRESDITLADFWGIENTGKAFPDDDTGVSLVLVNTKKGKDLIQSIRKDSEMVKSSHSAFYQPIFERPSKISPRRPLFWKEYFAKGNAALVKYGKLTATQWMIKKIIVPVLKKTGLYNRVVKICYSSWLCKDKQFREQ